MLVKLVTTIEEDVRKNYEIEIARLRGIIKIYDRLSEVKIWSCNYPNCIASYGCDNDEETYKYCKAMETCKYCHFSYCEKHLFHPYICICKDCELKVTISNL